MAQDDLQRAKELYQDASDAFREQRTRMLEDLRFSNPAKPEQWDERARTIRENGPDGARPCLTLDHTNQYIAQVVNDARQNKPGINFSPASGKASQEVAKALDGIIRHVEYQSRAQIAYDTAVEHTCRTGLGWIRLVPEVVNAELNYQEVRIKRVFDSLSIIGDPDWQEPDGSDIQHGFVETLMSKAALKKRWPKASVDSWSTEMIASGWMASESIRVCEMLELVKTKTNRIVIRTAEGMRQSLDEDEFWNTARQLGYQPMVEGTYVGEAKKVMWRHMNGAEILEETEFPSCYVPLIPVVGYELFVEGKRYLAGMVRRMREAQMAYNYERSAWVEAVALQPKAPFIADSRAIEGYENEWARLNKSNLAYVPVNGIDENNNPIPLPQRASPPQMPAAFSQGAQFAQGDIQASIGMFNASLGAQTQEHSGIAIRAKQREGDTANFHYIDNLSRSIERCGRIALDMITRLYDEPREARILGQDGTAKPVRISNQGEAYALDGDTASINPSTGSYDVRVKAGPSYTTLREEASEHLGQIIQGNPQLAAIVAPIWARMQDWPEADKLSKALLAMAPPPVQAAMDDDSQQESVDDLKKKLMQQDQQMQQMHQLIDQASAKLQELQSEDKATQLEYLAKAAQIENDMYAKVTDRIKAMQTGMTPEQVQALVMQVLANAAQATPEGAEDLEAAIHAGPDIEGMQPQGMPQGQEAAETTEPQDGSITPQGAA